MSEIHKMKWSDSQIIIDEKDYPETISPDEGTVPLVGKFRFWVPNGIWLTRDCLGKQFGWSMVEHGAEASVKFPHSDTEWLIEPKDSLLETKLKSWYPSSAQTVAVKIIQIQVRFRGKITWFKEAIPGSPELMKVGLKPGDDLEWSKNRAVNLANKAVSEWMSHLKILPGGWWLGMQNSGTEPWGLYELYDESRLKTVGRFQHNSVSMARRESDCITFDELIMTESRIRDSVSPDIWDKLLSESQYLCNGTGPKSKEIDLERSIISLGMSCEIKAKHHLSLLGTPSTQEMVDYILKSRSNLTDLVGKISKIIVQRSLKEDDPIAWAVAAHITTARNRVVHEGITDLSLREVQYMVEHARKIFSWIDSLDGSIIYEPSKPRRRFPSNEELRREAREFLNYHTPVPLNTRAMT